MVKRGVTPENSRRSVEDRRFKRVGSSELSRICERPKHNYRGAPLRWRASRNSAPDVELSKVDMSKPQRDRSAEVEIPL